MVTLVVARDTHYAVLVYALVCAPGSVLWRSGDPGPLAADPQLVF